MTFEHQIKFNKIFKFFTTSYIVSNFVIFLHQIYIFKRQVMHIHYFFHAINKFKVFLCSGRSVAIGLNRFYFW